ncbi:MAG: efflux RND transporter permease subunit [Alphaproteobacteria bacterium]
MATPDPSKEYDDNALQSGLINWFAHNHVAANILMMLFLIGGLLSIKNMRTETFPSIDPRLVTISVVYPGATPYEIADSITSRAEEAVIGIEGVKRITAKAAEGYGLISIELKDFANADDVYNDVETAINSLSDFPPQDAERAQIVKAKYTPAVLNLALHGDVDEKTLKYWAENIENDLRQLPGVALTELSGIRDYEISIEISERNLQQYGLTLENIGNAIAAFSTDVPAGTIESAGGEILLRVQERRYTEDDFKKVILRTLPDGRSLTLKDIATIDDGFEDFHLISRFNGDPAAFINVKRSESDDTLSTANTVKDYLKTVSLPAGLQVSLQSDETVPLRERINLMMRNSILGFMLVFVILLLFLDLKLAFWTSIAIPVSFLGGLMIINFLGYSMNMITLFALIVVLGIVVDDAIVTGESIFEAQKKRPGDPNATLKGVKAVIAPVTVGVTTTMAAFAPLIFSTGTMGQIIGVIPVVVIPILFISLMEAYFILPAHLSNPTRWNRGIVATIRNGVAKGLEWFIDNIVLPLARFSMQWRYASVAFFLCFAFLTIGLFKSGEMRFIFFPQVESDEIAIDITMPTGTPFNVTQDMMNNIEAEAIKIREQLKQNSGTDAFESTALTIGASSREAGPGSAGGSESAPNIGQLKIRLVSSDLRANSAQEIETMIRKRIEDFVGYEEMSFQSSLVGNEADIEIELSHSDEATLNTAAEDLKSRIKAINGTQEVADTFELGKTEYVFELTPEGLAAGLTPIELGQQLRHAYFGFEAQRFQRGRNEIIVYVRYPKEERENPAMLDNTRIRLNDGSEVPLLSVAKIKQQNGYSQINSVNGHRVVSVTSDVDYAITTPNEIIADLRANTLPDLAARYQGLSYSFEGESREQGEDLKNLGKNMTIALLLIYVLLGAQLRSYVQPIIIMSAIPFGIVGAIWGHYLLGHDFTFISLFGIVALSGVVVNDSVVLVDYYNHQIRKAGGAPYQSMLTTIKRRFRPILLTTLTTSLGLLPMLMEKSLQAQFLIPMVISLATGIIFASIVIMFLIPNLVLIIEDFKSISAKTRRTIGNLIQNQR